MSTSLPLSKPKGVSLLDTIFGQPLITMATFNKSLIN